MKKLNNLEPFGEIVESLEEDVIEFTKKIDIIDMTHTGSFCDFFISLRWIAEENALKKLTNLLMTYKITGMRANEDYR